jgi:hypothetical protein
MRSQTVGSCEVVGPSAIFYSVTSTLHLELQSVCLSRSVVMTSHKPFVLPEHPPSFMIFLSDSVGRSIPVIFSLSPANFPAISVVC